MSETGGSFGGKPKFQPGGTPGGGGEFLIGLVMMGIGIYMVFSRVVVHTSYSDRDQILNALDAGAVGYLLKDADPPELIAGIRAAADGDSPQHPKAASAVLRARAERRPIPELSEREREVLELVATGLSNQKIAARLGISEKTVKAHLTSVFRQLGVEDRTQAAVWARQHGLAPAGESR